MKMRELSITVTRNRYLITSFFYDRALAFLRLDQFKIRAKIHSSEGDFENIRRLLMVVKCPRPYRIVYRVIDMEQ